MNTKEKHEEKLMTCIDIPYFKNNPAYIDLWRSYYMQFKDPNILFLMYHKQISIYFHWIHIELSQYFLKKKQPQIAQFILEEAIRNKVYDQERLKEALSQMPKFEKKYNRGDLLALLNFKNIKCLGRIWNCYNEENFYINNLPSCYNTFEEMKIAEYEKIYIETQITSEFSDHIVSIFKKEKDHCIIEKCNNENSEENTETRPDKDFDINSSNTKIVNESLSPEDIDLSIIQEEILKNNAGEYNVSKIENNSLENENMPYTNESCLIVYNNDKNINFDDLNNNCNKSEDSYLCDNHRKKICNISNNSFQIVNENTSNKLSILDDNALKIDENNEDAPNCSLKDDNCDQNIFIDSSLQPSTIEFPSKLKAKDSLFFESFLPSTFEIKGELELGGELQINGFIYIVHSVLKNGFSLLKIAEIENVTQTILGESSLLIKSDIHSLDIANNIYKFNICNQQNNYFILFDFVLLCSFEDILCNLSMKTKAFYLQKIIEKLIPLTEKSFMISEPLNFFIDQNFNIEFGSFVLNSNHDSIQKLKEAFPEFEISISNNFIKTLQKMINTPEAKREIIKHKTELLENL